MLKRFFKTQSSWEWLGNFKKEDRAFTPDVPMLDNRQWHHLFVYGRMQSRQPLHDKLGEEAERLCVAWTKQNNLVMLKKTLGDATFPIVIPTNSQMQFGRNTYLGVTGRVQGELYKVRPSTIKDLDNHYENGIQSTRMRVPLEIQYRLKEGKTVGDHQVHTLKAWMYVGKLSYWSEVLNPVFYTNVKTFFANNPKDELYYWYDHKFESVA